jgi:hypothetical protein
MATITKGYEWLSGATVTPARLNDAIDDATIADIVNADISASAAIADTKLATIATAGKVSNSATTAASANTASAIVARDGSGNFAAGTITASLTGNVTGNVTGNLTGTASAVAAAAVTVGKLDGRGANSGGALAVGTAPVFGCRAWVIFNGQRNVTDTGAATVGQPVLILGSGNVSSVTLDADVGRFTVNFTTAMAHANYAAVANFNESNNDTRSDNDGQASCHTHATGSVKVVCAESNDDAAATRVSVVVFC